MHPDFARLMQDATRLTREGDLSSATAAIQAALGAGAEPAAQGEVIDVEARVVPDDAAPANEAIRLPSADGTQQPSPSFRANEPAPAAPAHEEARPAPTSRQEAFLSGQFGAGPAARDYKLFVPGGAHAGPLSLVVMLHGCTQDPNDFAAGTAMNDAAREQGFFVLYPAQSQKANPQRCWNWFKHSHQQRGRGEPALIADMTRDVMSRYPIDPSRVYVAGLSAGGAMAAVLGEAYPDLFAAVGVHSGLQAGAARDLPSAMEAMKSGRGSASKASASRVPTIVFHGDADRTVHVANGRQAFAAGAATGTVREEEAGSSAGGRRWTRHVQRDAKGDVVAEFWELHGAGHAWSGGKRGGSYTDPAGPDATAAMLRFFAGQRLSA